MRKDLNSEDNPTAASIAGSAGAMGHISRLGGGPPLLPLLART